MKILIMIATVLLGLYFGWQSLFTTGSWNYKLTLVVETPEGVKTGSAVRKVFASNNPDWFPESVHGHAGVKGEAVVVDLGERGVLFVLLKSVDDNDYGYRIIFNEFPSGVRSGTTTEGIHYYSNLKAKKELGFDKVPMLVRFRDIQDPKTVELVDPNDLEKTFGQGVKLVSATLEMTDEAVTAGVEKWLPWIRNYYDNKLDGNRYEGGNAPPTLANKLSSGNFTTELSPYGR